MTLHTLVLMGLADSEYSSPLCNPQVSSLHAEASSRAIVVIDDCCGHQQPHTSFTHSNTWHPNSWHQPSSQTRPRPQMEFILTTIAWLSLTSRCFAKLWTVTQLLSRVWLSYNWLDNISPGLYSNDSIIQTILLFKQFLLSIGGLW